MVSLLGQYEEIGEGKCPSANKNVEKQCLIVQN